MTREEGHFPDSDEESPEVRALLLAGIDDQVRDYDFERGLATHLSAIGGAPAPTAPDPASAPAPGGPSASAKMTLKTLAGWLSLPVVAATVAAAFWMGKGAAPSPELASASSVTQPQLPPGTNVAGSTDAPGVSENGTANAGAVTDVPAKVEGSDPSRSARDSDAPGDRSSALRSTDPAELAAKRRAGASANGSTRDALLNRLAAASKTSVRSGAKGSSGGPTGTPGNAASDAVDADFGSETGALVASAAPEAAHKEPAPPPVIEEPPKVVMVAPAEERLKLEMGQLSKARRALADNPAEALQLATQGEREFGHSLFSEERQHVLLLSLIALGRVDEAQKRAAPYLRAHPGSPFARRVERALEAAKARPAKR